MNKQNRVYDISQIYVATFIGGLLAVGYMLAQNFKIFGQSEAAIKTWWVTTVVMSLILTVPLICPFFYGQCIPLILAGIICCLAHFFQGSAIADYKASGGLLFSWWRALGVGVIMLIITALLALAMALTFNGINEPANSNKRIYGEVQHQIFYDNHSVSIEETDALANALVKAGFFDMTVKKHVYVKKNGSTIFIYILCNENVMHKAEAEQWFVQLKNDLQVLYSKNKIVLELRVDRFDSKAKTIE